MTIEQAFQVAAQMLDERGQLLNAHLFRLVERDDELFRAVRKRLVSQGIAEDRSGIGLISINRTGRMLIKEIEESGGAGSTADTVDTPIDESDPAGFEWALTPEWWLMSSGATRGPFDLVTLCEMRQHGDLTPADVVRQGTQGLWQRLDDVPLLAASLPGKKAGHPSANWDSRRSGRETAATDRSTGKGTSSLSQDERHPDQQVDQFVPPEKLWDIKHRSNRNWLVSGWSILAGFVGGSRRLAFLLVSLTIIGAAAYWWRLPPSADTIVAEFTRTHAVFRKLYERRAKRADWDEATVKYRPRLQMIVDRLAPRATNKRPVEQDLYLAGMQGLLPYIDSYGSSSAADLAFETYMNAARGQLDGKTNE